MENTTTPPADLTWHRLACLGSTSFAFDHSGPVPVKWVKFPATFGTPELVISEPCSCRKCSVR